MSKIWSVGNHAYTLLSTFPWEELAFITFTQGAPKEGNLGTLTIANNQAANAVAYQKKDLALSLHADWKEEDKVWMIGDISERVVDAALQVATERNTLLGMLVLYPVGMVALDVRREMAEIILHLKKNNIPTYLIREPNAFFETAELNYSSLVEPFSEGGNTKYFEYLCGMSVNNLSHI